MSRGAVIISVEDFVVLVHDNLCSSKAAIVFFGIDMSLLTTAVSADDGRDTGLQGIGCVGGADFLVLGISKVERPYTISWRSKISS